MRTRPALEHKFRTSARRVAILIALLFLARFISSAADSGVRQGKAAMNDWGGDAPGVRRRITINDLPPPGSNALAINSTSGGQLSNRRRTTRSAWGIRNAAGIAFRPGTSELWMSTNERDELGDNLVPDYISRVRPEGFYGWPWFYLGNHVDPSTQRKTCRSCRKVRCA